MLIVANILNRDFYASNANEKYVGDITYIPIGEGWLYLATVIDLYSRKVVGWSMDTMKVSLVNDALNMAILHKKPPIGLYGIQIEGVNMHLTHIKIYYKNIIFLYKETSKKRDILIY